MHYFISILSLAFVLVAHGAAPEKKKNRPPTWNRTELTLPKAWRSAPFDARVPGDAVTDEDGDSVTYKLEKGSGPAWLKISRDGAFSGTPSSKDRGRQTWRVTATDGKNSATISVAIEIENRAPEWQAFSLPDVTERQKLASSLSAWAKDPDGDKLSFTKTAGPDWIQVAPSGAVSGSPPEGTHGRYSVSLQVSDGEVASDTSANGTIIQTNYAPTVSAIAPQTVRERETFKLDLNPYLGDRNPADKPSAHLKDARPWYSLTNNVFEARPEFGQIGTHTIALAVSDGQMETKSSFTLVVSRNARPPEWTALKPVSILAREPFKTSVATYAKDADRQALTFSKLSGPAWVSVSKQGEISGTPADSDVGSSDIRIGVANDGASSDASFLITVNRKNYPPVVNKPWKVEVKERETAQLSLARSGSVSDADGESLAFSCSKLPSWAKMTAEGEFVFNPLFAHIGTHQFSVTAKDKEQSVEVPVTIEVKRNVRAPQWNPLRPVSALSRDPFKTSVAHAAGDLDGLPVTFSKVEGPPWLSVSKDGTLSGTPADIDAKDWEVVLRVSNDLASSDTTLALRVTKKNYPPVLVKPWVFSLKEREVTEANLSLAGCVSDPDGESLTFTSTKLPAWAQLSPEGGFVFRPQYPQIGTHKFSVLAKDKEQSVEIPVTLDVKRNPRAPEWQEPAISFEVLTREPFKLSVSDKVKDLDGRPFTISMVSGPALVTVTPQGALSGTPTDEQKGTYDIVLKADNKELISTKSVRLVVKTKNHAPDIKPNWLVQVKERSDSTIDLADPKYVVDVDGDKLDFRATDKPAWVDLTPSGQVRLRPAYAQIGKHAIKVEVADGQLKSLGSLSVVVERDPRPPVWTQNDIRFQAKAREPFRASVSGSARDLDGLPVTFAKKSGPKWISVSPKGEITGTPEDGDIGESETAVTVANDKLEAPAEVKVVVIHKNHPPAWTSKSLDLGKLRAGDNLQTSIDGAATDVDPGDSLVFEKVKGPSWLVVRVLDASREPASVSAHVKVAPAPGKPTPKKEPIQLPAAYAGELFTFSLAREYAEPDLTFRKLDGPEWLSLRSTGELAGVPSSSGDFKFVVEVSNGQFTVQTKGVGKVSTP